MKNPQFYILFTYKCCYKNNFQGLRLWVYMPENVPLYHNDFLKRLDQKKNYVGNPKKINFWCSNVILNAIWYSDYDLFKISQSMLIYQVYYSLWCCILLHYNSTRVTVLKIVLTRIFLKYDIVFDYINLFRFRCIDYWITYK